MAEGDLTTVVTQLIAQVTEHAQRSQVLECLLTEQRDGFQRQLEEIRADHQRREQKLRAELDAFASRVGSNLQVQVQPPPPPPAILYIAT